MIRTNLCDYKDSYIFVSGTVTVTQEGDNSKRADERNKGVILKIEQHILNVYK